MAKKYSAINRANMDWFKTIPITCLMQNESIPIAISWWKNPRL